MGERVKVQVEGQTSLVQKNSSMDVSQIKYLHRDCSHTLTACCAELNSDHRHKFQRCFLVKAYKLFTGGLALKVTKYSEYGAARQQVFEHVQTPNKTSYGTQSMQHIQILPPKSRRRCYQVSLLTRGRDKNLQPNSEILKKNG